MAEGGYQAAEAIVAENRFQVATLGGERKTLRLAYGETWEGFKKLIETEFNIPGGLQKLAQDDHVLEFDKTDCIVELVETSKLPEDKDMTVTCLAGAWFWADATGNNPSPTYADHADSYKGLRNICSWLEDAHGEDTDTEELGAGVIYLPDGNIPQTSADLLKFLSGSEEHELAIAMDEDGEATACPWNDIAEMAAVTISDIWPPPRAISNNSCAVTPYPSAEEVTRALLCAEAEAAEEDVKHLASQSFFFACTPSAGTLKKESEMEAGSFFYQKDHAEPHVFVCANPTKQTIAFCYQTTFWC